MGEMEMEIIREVKQIVNGMKASDGDGVQLTRIIGSPYLEMLDPFLLFDAFGSDQAQDYIGGFPAHPHRGFETVTYMLHGKMRHQDNAGNSGVISAGGVQWMTAGRGIIHSEMPEQTQGLLAGFQLWVNLPAADKMCEPKYQEKPVEEVPLEIINDQSSLKVIAGTTQNGTQGIIENDKIKPIYWDINLAANSAFNNQLPSGHNAFIYVINGKLSIGQEQTFIEAGQLAVLTPGDKVNFAAIRDSRFLFIAGKPLNEPVVRAGPFVMNSREEINQAMFDYQNGNFA